MNIEVFEAERDGTDLRVGIVQSRFNGAVCDALRAGCLDELARLGVAAEDVFVASVPGALEIPYALARMAESGEFDALIALGAVIRGETYHFEVVSNESAAGVGRVALEWDIPVANAILTTETDEQAEVRAAEKGRDAARVAVEMANLGASLGLLGGLGDDDDDDDEDDEDQDDDEDEDQDDDEDEDRNDDEDEDRNDDEDEDRNDDEEDDDEDEARRPQGRPDTDASDDPVERVRQAAEPVSRARRHHRRRARGA